MNKINLIVMFSIIMLFIIGGVSFIILSINGVEQNKEGKYVNCYDKYGNRIIGETCYVEPMDKNEVFTTRFMLFILGCFFLWIAGYIIYSFNQSNNVGEIFTDNENE